MFCLKRLIVLLIIMYGKRFGLCFERNIDGVRSLSYIKSTLKKLEKTNGSLSEGKEKLILFPNPLCPYKTTCVL